MPTYQSTTQSRKSQEFLKTKINASAIAPELAAKNFFPWDGETDADFIFSELNPLPQERTNLGRLAASPLKKYNSIYSDYGFYSITLDPLNPALPPQFHRARFATNKPKYLAPATGTGTGWKLGFLDVDTETWQKIATQNNASYNPYFDTDFWLWVQQQRIPIVPTEGTLKAACAMSCGFVSIALPGIWQGCVKGGREFFLHPQLEPFARAGCPFYLCFDTEFEAKKNVTVNQAKERLERCLKLYRAKVFDIVLPAVYDDAKTGLDDFVAACGKSGFIELFENAIEDPIKAKMKAKMRLQIDSSEVFTANSKVDYFWELQTSLTSTLQDFKAKDEPFIFCAKGLQGSQKTRFCQQVMADLGYPILSFGTTNTLQFNQVRALQDLGVDILHIHSLAKGKKDGDNGDSGLEMELLRDPHQSVGSAAASLFKFTAESARGKILWLDEVQETLLEIYLGETCRQRRSEIIETFHGMLRCCAGVFMAQAEISDKIVDHIARVSGIDKNIIKVQSSYIPPLKTVNFCFGSFDKKGKIKENDFTPLYESLLAEIACNRCLPESVRKCIMVQSDSKKFLKQIFLLLSKAIPDLDALEVNSETRGNPEILSRDENGIVCGGFLNNPTEFLENRAKKYDIILASPTLSTGSSIENEGYFSSVYLFGFHLSPVALHQMLNRVREAVPAKVWVAPRRFFALGSDDVLNFTAKNILNAAWFSRKVEAKFLGNEDYFATERNERDRDYALFYTDSLAAEAKARQGFEGTYLRESFLHQLEKAGNPVIAMEVVESNEKAIKKELKAANATILDDAGKKIFEAPKTIEINGEQKPLSYHAANEILEGGTSNIDKVSSAKKVILEHDFLGGEIDSDPTENNKKSMEVWRKQQKLKEASSYLKEAQDNETLTLKTEMLEKITVEVETLTEEIKQLKVDNDYSDDNLYYSHALAITYFEKKDVFKCLEKRHDIKNVDILIQRERAIQRANRYDKKRNIPTVILERKQNLTLMKKLGENSTFNDLINAADDKSKVFTSEDLEKLGQVINAVKGEKRHTTNATRNALASYGYSLVEVDVKVNKYERLRGYRVVDSAKKELFKTYAAIESVENFKIPIDFEWVEEKIAANRDKFYKTEAIKPTQIFSQKQSRQEVYLSC